MGRQHREQNWGLAFQILRLRHHFMICSCAGSTGKAACHPCQFKHKSQRCGSRKTEPARTCKHSANTLKRLSRWGCTSKVSLQLSSAKAANRAALTVSQQSLETTATLTTGHVCALCWPAAVSARDAVAACAHSGIKRSTCTQRRAQTMEETANTCMQVLDCGNRGLSVYQHMYTYLRTCVSSCFERSIHR